MNWGVVLAAVTSGYLLGSIPFAVLLAKIFAPGVDLGHTEVTYSDKIKVVMTNVSATTLSFAVSKRLGMVCSLLDMAKAAGPTLVFKLLYPQAPYFLVVAVAALIGHNWPLFNRFRGGRGFSPIYGSLLVIDWTSVPVSFLASLAFMIITRQLFLGFITALLSVIPWLWFRTRSLEQVLYATAINVIYVIGMIPEIKMYREQMRAGIDMEAVRNLSVLDVMPHGDRVKKILSGFRQSTRDAQSREVNDEPLRETVKR